MGWKLSGIWGDGSRSSFRWPAFRGPSGAVSSAASIHAISVTTTGRFSFYTHTSDQNSVYGTQVISCAPREAGYVLGGILDNDTELTIREHTSDTNGFTEHLFGLLRTCLVFTSCPD